MCIEGYIRMYVEILYNKCICISILLLLTSSSKYTTLFIKSASPLLAA